MPNTTILEKRSWHQPLTLGGLVIVVAVAESVGLLQFSRAWGERLFNPIQVAGVNAVTSITTPYYVLRNSYNSARYIQDLEYRYSESLAQLGELTALQKENQELRVLIEQQPQTTQKRSVSTPILSLANPALASGSHQGIAVGNMVLVAHTLVGRVTEVSEYQSNVTLLNQMDSVPVLAQTETGAQGLVVGDGRRVLFTEVPLDTPLTVGQRITTMGQEGIQRDILVGKIQTIVSPPSASVQTAVVEQLVSFHQARVVEVY